MQTVKHSTEYYIQLNVRAGLSCKCAMCLRGCMSMWGEKVRCQYCLCI